MRAKERQAVVDTELKRFFFNSRLLRSAAEVFQNRKKNKNSHESSITLRITRRDINSYLENRLIRKEH